MTPTLALMQSLCPDCDCAIGELHDLGCDVERCPQCGGQMISCNCTNGSNIERMPWSGKWPGTAECEEYGWWVVGPPWKQVPAGTKHAVHDMNRLVLECEWDRTLRKFVPRKR